MRDIKIESILFPGYSEGDEIVKLKALRCHNGMIRHTTSTRVGPPTHKRFARRDRLASRGHDKRCKIITKKLETPCIIV